MEVMSHVGLHNEICLGRRKVALYTDATQVSQYVFHLR